MANVEVTMPKMGESITEGTVIVWHKQPGDAIEMDETLLEIGTDKVDTEVPSPAAGVLQKILVPEGETVDVGTAIAIIDTNGQASNGEQAAPEAKAPVVEEKKPAATPAPEPVKQPAPAPPKPAPAPASALAEVPMPKMGESITEGTVIVWHKQPGDAIEMDETLLEIGTDKVDTEVPSPAAGVLHEILIPEGETVDVGTVLATIRTGAAAEQAAPETPPQPSAPVSEAVEQVPASQPVSPTPAEEQPEHDRFLSPLVRSIVAKEGLSAAEVQAISGSGREGRLTKKDVLAYLENRSAQPAPVPAVSTPKPAAPAPKPAPKPVEEEVDYGARVEIIEMDRMRQLIAEHMVRSKATSAHVTSFAEIDVTNLVRLRERRKDAFLQSEGIKLTYTPFFVKAAVEALASHPILNASVEGKRIIIKKDHHIGIAVALEKVGLIVPVIRDAGRKNLVGLAHAANDLAARARSKQLQPDDLQGGTFTVTNVGSLGSIMGTPIIPQPQVAILATGAIKKRPVVIEDPALGDVIAIRHMMYASLSYDHRIIDGAMAVSFLRAFTHAIESLDPEGDV